MPTSLTASSVTDAGRLIVDPVRAIAPLPDLGDDVGDDFGRLLPMPLVTSQCALDREENTGGDNLTMLNLEGRSENAHRSFTEVSAASWNFVDTTPNTSDEACIESRDEICFCSPIVEFIKQMFKMKQPSTVVVSHVTTDKLTQESRLVQRLPSTSSESTRPIPIIQQKMSPPDASTINQYNMPLKPPARSDPVPISDQKVKILPRNLSRTFTTRTSASLARPLSSSKSMSVLPNKDSLLPPPPDYIDPKDGHIWRSKYCILEEGILYFYRTAAEGESAEAEAERYESRLYSEELEDIVLGEDIVISSPSRNSGGRAADVLPAPDSRISRDIYDLSKSPMPRSKSNLFAFRQGSNTGVFTSSVGGSSRPSLPHSNSTSTFHNEPDVLWEKRVALNCVGAVRSSEQEHGTNAFELIAHDVGSEGQYDGRSDVGTRKSTCRGEGVKYDINNRLILRAGSSDERNDWMFQFHRSLTSILMQKIVKSVGNGNNSFTGRGNPPFGARPDSPICSGQYHRRLPSGGAPDNRGSISSPFVAISSFASSPNNGNNSFGGNSFSSNFVGSLSHGHGRNALYRRQVRDGKSVGGSSSALSPLPTPAGTPRGASSPIDANNSTPNLVIQSDSSATKRKVDLICLRELRQGGTKEDVNLQDSPTIEAPKKYVPPHMRKKLLHESNDDTAATKNIEEQVPLNYEKKERRNTLPNINSSEESGNESLSDSAFSAASSSLSIQLEDMVESFSVSINVRLGGCADPTVVVGSIIDDFYIDRKASVVGNARLEAYGGTGGGYFSLPSSDRRHQYRTEKGLHTSESKSTRSVLKWEVGASSECGVRNTNEDSYVVINNLDELIQSQGLVSFSQQDLGQTKQQSLYAIFDGHVGNQAAR
jgi:hypothetical protein